VNISSAINRVASLAACAGSAIPQASACAALEVTLRTGCLSPSSASM